MTDAGAASFRDILRSELEVRAKRNPAYSLRAFARDLGVSASRLSEITTGAHAMSLATGAKVAKALGFEAARAAHFTDLVEAECSRSPKKRCAASERITAYLATEAAFEKLRVDAFHVISDWYHLAIVEATKVADFDGTAAWLAERLGIPTQTAKHAVDRLIRIGMLRADGETLTASKPHYQVMANIPSKAVHSFHKQILERAYAAVDKQAVALRKIEALITTIPATQVPEFKQHIEDFIEQMSAKFRQATPKEAIYCLSLQFFQLDQTSRPDDTAH